MVQQAFRPACTLSELPSGGVSHTGVLSHRSPTETDARSVRSAYDPGTDTTHSTGLVSSRSTTSAWEAQFRWLVRYPARRLQKLDHGRSTLRKRGHMENIETNNDEKEKEKDKKSKDKPPGGGVTPRPVHGGWITR